MAPRRKNKPTRPHPRGQKPMVRAKPSSDPTAANALSAHVAGKTNRQTTTTTSSSSGTGKRQRIKTHGPLGNVRVDKRATNNNNNNKKKNNSTANKPQTAADLQLNTSTKPAGIIHRRGKKGKIFADDTNALTKVLSVVTAKMDEIHATKIERAQQLEQIRQAKRIEIEQKQQQKIDRLESKKKEIKNRKRNQNHDTGLHDDHHDDAPAPKRNKKQKVRFAV
ncbi:hypothetical protein V1525DRAFT_398607 [Lipomyces kononenkoae]|uniref:Uncharacterized protein n=1 Tax=Lipomyces kononenkoae TaxID=34357 RepID=A0ACC3T6U6_LIPKO